MGGYRGDYIASVDVELGPLRPVQGGAGLVSSVKVSWVRGPEEYDFLEIWHASVAGGAGSASRDATLRKDQPDHYALDLSPGIWNVILAPRMSDGAGGTSPLIPDAQGVPQPFETFDLTVQVVVPQSAQPSSGPARPAPRITSAGPVGLGPDGVGVHIAWNHPAPYEFYQVRWREKGLPVIEERLPPGQREYVLPADRVFTGVTYVFIVQGCNSGVFQSICSPWSAPVEVAVETGSSTSPPIDLTAQAEGWNGIRLSWSHHGPLDSQLITRIGPHGAAPDIRLPGTERTYLDTDWLPNSGVSYAVIARRGRLDPSAPALVEAKNVPERRSSAVLRTRFRGAPLRVVLPQGRNVDCATVVESQHGFVVIGVEQLPLLGAGSIDTAPLPEDVIDVVPVEPWLHLWGSLDCVVRRRPVKGGPDRLTFQYREPFESNAAQPWSPAVPVVADGSEIMGVTGSPALLAGAWGGNGNYELLVPIGDSVAHLWRDNDAGGYPWHRAPDVMRAGGSASGGAEAAMKAVPTGVSAIQAADADGPGPVECYIRMQPAAPLAEAWLLHFAFDPARRTWVGPNPLTSDTGPFSDVAAAPALLQTVRGGVEMLLVQGEEVVHYHRPSSASGWLRQGLVSGSAGAASGAEKALPGSPASVALTSLGPTVPGRMLALVRTRSPLDVDGAGDRINCFVADIPGDVAPPQWHARGPLTDGTGEPVRVL